MTAKLSMAIVFAAMASSAATGQTSAPEKRPEFPKSIANVTSSHFREGPLFQRAKKVFRAAKTGNDADFNALLTQNAQLRMSNFSYPKPPEHKPIAADFFRALSDSCDGPLSYDEGKDWVELNWVCSIDSSTPLARHYTFRESPEVVMFVLFQGDKIKKIDANEPLWVPGTKRLAMNAYAVAHDKDGASSAR